jgi:hypothetical protein
LRLSCSAQNVVGEPIGSLPLSISADGKAAQSITLPGSVDVPDDATRLDLSIAGGTTMPWQAYLLLAPVSTRWHASDPTLELSFPAPGMLTLVITLGQVRFAPIRANNPKEQIPLMPDKLFPLDFNPGGALVDVDQSIYRGVFLSTLDITTVDSPAIGNASASAWNRFKTRVTKVPLAALGNFVLLEYGDGPTPAPGAGGTRFLIGVWAPLQFAGTSPVTVVQLTPNTAPPFGYPTDSLPFGKVYPYAMTLPRKLTDDEIKNNRTTLDQLRQPYCELPSARTILSHKVVYQIYAARPDVFGGDTVQGPIVITPVPVALNTKDYVQRAPFNQLPGMGRLIREVIHFLAASRLSSAAPGSNVRLRFRPPVTNVVVSPPTALVNNRPSGRARVVVLTHSAGVFALAPLLTQQVAAQPTEFPAGTWAASGAEFWADWRGIWLIDGVGNPGHLSSPVPNSGIARQLKAWTGGGTRKLVAVYTSPSGIASNEASGLVSISTPFSHIEEARGANGTIVWLRMAGSYLQATPGAKRDGTLPAFGVPSDEHNFVYYFGPGYAAAASR